MNKNVMIDAISAIDQKYIIEYVQYETKLGILKCRRKNRTRSLLICAACLVLVVCMLAVSLPLSFVVLGSEPVREWRSQVIESVLFPLDQQPENPDDPDDPAPPTQSLLQLNWVEWEITERIFSALGAGTDDSVIDKLQSIQSDGLLGERMQDLGFFFERLYEYYMKHKDEIDSIVDEIESESETDTETDVTGTDAETEYETEQKTEQSTENGSNDYGIKYGDLRYIVLNDGTASIVGYDGKEPHLEIPPNIEGVRVTEIADSAFCDNQVIESVFIPDSVIRIRGGAFWHCRSLKTVNLPSELEVLGNYAFADCNNLVGEIVIPQSLKEAGILCFSQCSSLRTIMIEDGVTQLFREMFAEADGLESIIIPETVTSLPVCLFGGCDNLVEVKLPSGLKEIGTDAFSHCFKLKEIEIPDGVETIGQCAFYCCESLTEIHIPDTVKTMGVFTFAVCPSLTKLHLSESLKEFPAQFIEDVALEELIIPEGVESIGVSAVKNCPNLLRIYIPMSVNSIHDNAFEDINEAVCYIYPGSIEDWTRVTVSNTAFATGSVIICTDGEIVIE